MRLRWYHWTLVGLGLPVLLIVAYISFVEWDIYRVKSICREIRPGASIEAARAVVRSYGLDRYLPDLKSAYPNGVRDTQTGGWFFAVPAGTTLGDWACGISHDGTTILATRLLTPSDY